MQDLASVESVSARLETVLIRLSAHFRSMPESKLLGRLPDGRSRAAAGHELAGRVALAAQGVEDRDLREPPAWRALPFEGPFVVGDQIGVTGHDLLVASAMAISASVMGISRSAMAIGASAMAKDVSAMTGDGYGRGDGDSGLGRGDGVSEVWVPGAAARAGDEGCARVAVGELLGRVLSEAEGLARIL